MSWCSEPPLAGGARYDRVERAASGIAEAGEWEGKQSPDAVVPRHGWVSETLDEWPGDGGADGCDEVQPVRGQSRGQHRQLEDERPPSADVGDAPDHVAVGDDLRAADVEAFAE